MFALWQLTGKGFVQYGYLKNIGLASNPTLIKGNQFKTFSKAHIAESYC
jgi:hypothetical protein